MREPSESARSTEGQATRLVTVKQAASVAHLPVSFIKREVTPVACNVQTRALLYPFAAVMRAERDSRVARLVNLAARHGFHLRHADRCA